MPGVLRDGPPLLAPPKLARPPGYNRIFGLLSVLLLLLGLLGWWGWRRGQESVAKRSTLLNEHVLAGPRGPSCLRLIIGLDVSGSMSSFAAPRDAALAQLLTWVQQPGNLRANDEIAVVDFAFDAAVRRPPGPITRSTGGGSAPVVHDGSNTLLAPLMAIISTFPATMCDNELILISDAQLADLPMDAAQGRQELADYGVHDVRLLVPGKKIQVFGQWDVSFPEAKPRRFDGSDPNATALIFGETIAELTRQQLVVRPTRI